MHKIRVIKPHYDQSRPYSGKVGEVIGHWGSESNRDGREGYLVEIPTILPSGNSTRYPSRPSRLLSLPQCPITSPTLPEYGRDWS